MQKKDNKIGNKTAYKEERQIKEKKKAREKERNRFAKKKQKNESKFWLVHMPPPPPKRTACKEICVRWAGASGFCCQASGFCS